MCNRATLVVQQSGGPRGAEEGAAPRCVLAGEFRGCVEGDISSDP